MSVVHMFACYAWRRIQQGVNCPCAVLFVSCVEGLAMFGPESNVHPPILTQDGA